MSANTFTLTCIGDEAALSVLHGKLQAAIVADSTDNWPAPLDSVFEDWDRPSIRSASVRGATLRCMIHTSTSDGLELWQVLALHAAGVEYLRARVFNSQVGETDTTYYQAGKKIKAKAFPKLELSESERLYALVEEDKDTALAKEIKAGASVDAVIDGMPLFVHVLRNGMEKSVRAMADAKVDMGLCLPCASEVAENIHIYAGGKREALLAALLEQPAANLPVLARSAQFMRAVCVHPKLLKWLLAQDGVDPSARLYEDEAEVGSLLFHSVEFFENRAEVLKVLHAAGARSVPMSDMTETIRLERTLRGYRDADTPAELIAAGVDLNQPLWRDYSILRLSMDSYMYTHRELQLMTDLMDVGANTNYWMDADALQQEVLKPLFSAYWYVNEFEDRGCIRLDEARAQGILGIFGRLLERGLNAKMSVSFSVRDATKMNEVEMPYKGSLLGAVACVLCSRGSSLRPLCLPLVELLLSHGADPEATGLLSTDHLGRNRIKIWVDGDEFAVGTPWSEETSILSFLRQRQTEVPDEIDAMVIEAMSRPKGA